MGPSSLWRDLSTGPTSPDTGDACLYSRSIIVFSNSFPIGKQIMITA